MKKNHGGTEPDNFISYFFPWYHLHNSLVPFGYEKNPIFAKKKLHTLGHENIGCFFLMRRRALRRALQFPERSLDEWTWTDYYRNPCICNRWPFSSARVLLVR
jgi:hypothetical protein